MKKSSPPIWHSKTYMRFMLSFCLVLVLITLVFSYFLRSILFDSAEHDMIVSSQASVNQSAIHVDQLLTTMDAIVATISNSQNMSAYRIAPSDINRIQAMADLKHLRAFNSLIDNIYYLPVAGNYYLSAYSSYTNETFFKIYSRNQLSPELLKEYLARPYLPLLSFQDTITSDIMPRQEIHTLSTIFSLPYGGSGKYALLLIDIDSDRLQSLLKFNLQDGHVFLVNQENQPILSTSDWILTAEQIEQIANRSAAASPIVLLDSSPYYSFSSPLSHNWKLVCIKPQHIITQEVNLAQARYLTMSLCALAMGLLVSLLLSLWNYHPIAKLKQKVGSDATASRKTFSDDIKEIEQGLSDIVTQKNQLATVLEVNRQAIWSRHVFNLINNRFTPDDMERLTSDGLILRYTNYVIVAYSPRLSTPIRQDGGWIAQLSAAMPEAWDTYFLEYQASQLYVSLVSLPPMSIHELTREFDTIQRQLHAPVVISVSAQTPDLFNLAPAFIQAQNNLKQRFFICAQTLFIDSDANLASHSFNYPHNQLHKLELALASKNEEHCLEALNQLFADIRDASMTMDTLYCICFQVANQIIRQLEVNQVPLEQVEVLLPNILHITHNETLDELEEQIREAVESALDAVNHHTEQTLSTTLTFQEILEFIEQNGYRSDFSVQMVVDHFNISNPYLNKLFRESAGTTVNKFVQRIRITHARKLLVDTDLPLADIVEQVGYIDLSSFIKRFKQETGMTPVAYRKLYR